MERRRKPKRKITQKSLGLVSFFISFGFHGVCVFTRAHTGRCVTGHVTPKKKTIIKTQKNNRYSSQTRRNFATLSFLSGSIGDSISFWKIIFVPHFESTSDLETEAKRRERRVRGFPSCRQHTSRLLLLLEADKNEVCIPSLIRAAKIIC